MRVIQQIRKKIRTSIELLIKDSRSVGIILLICTAISLFVSNSIYADNYLHVWIKPLSHSHYLPHSVLHWINDGLMTIFFFLVGMEIKRELLYGELASLKKSILPFLGALGGMLVPAAIYIGFNAGSETMNGWGIPMATDIAFSLGVLSLVGKNIPFGLKIFLTALAIIDDLGAILVIALFYSNQLQWYFLLACVPIIMILWLLHKKKVATAFPFVIAGIALWFCFFNSGIHATISGVITAFFIPVARLNKYEHTLHTPVNFFILPLFALANTAIIIPAHALQLISSKMGWGIMLGLVLGKPLGIVLFVVTAIQLKWASLPEQATIKQIIGIGLLAGIGFTMSIFISLLAFQNPALQDVAKMAVLVAAVFSIVIGLIWLSYFAKTKSQIKN